MKIKKYISPALTTIFIVVFIYYFIQNKEDFTKLQEVSIFALILLGFLKILFIYINGLFTKIVLEAFNKEMSNQESFKLSLLSAIGNYFAPFQGGTGIRGIYLKKNFNLPYSHFMSITAGYYVIVFLVSAITGLIGSTYIHNKYSLFSEKLYIIFALILIGAVIATFVKLPRFIKDKTLSSPIAKRILKIINLIFDGWEKINSDKTLLYKLIGINITNFLIAGIVMYIEFYALGLTISIAGVAIYVSLSTLSSLISLTPGSIGIKEIIFILFANVIAVTETDILQVSLIDRGVVFFVLGASFLLMKIIEYKKQSQRKDFKPDSIN